MFTRITKYIGCVAVRQNFQYPAIMQLKYFSDKVNDTPSNVTDEQKTEPTDKLGTFAKAFNEFEEILKKPTKAPTENVPFKKLLRQSAFIDLGDPLDKIVKGKIVHTVGDDLYIDFGWKFYCVCVRPPKNGHLYVRGANVKLQIKELELSSRFLGEEKDLTILEADCILLGLISSPKSKTQPNSAGKN